MFRVSLLQRILQVDRGNCLRAWTRTRTRTRARALHTSRIFHKPVVLYDENKFAYSVMSNLGPSKYALSDELTKIDSSANVHETVEHLKTQELGKQSASELVAHFVLLSNQAQRTPLAISEDRFRPLVAALSKNVSQMSDLQLDTVLTGLQSWTRIPISSPNYKKLYQELDNTYLKRIPKWNIAKTLSNLDLWFKMGLLNRSLTSKQAFNKLFRKLDSLESHQLVQTMFYVNVSRDFKKMSVSHFKLEYRLNEIANDLCIDEIAILSMGLFKSQTKLRNNELVSKWIEKSLHAMRKCEPPIHEITLCAIAKVIRYCIMPELKWNLSQFMEEAVHHVDRVSFMTNLQLALVGSNIQTKSNLLLNKIFDKFFQNLENLRLKEIERLSFLLILYNWNPSKQEDYFQRILTEIKNPSRNDTDKYPKIFVSCVHFLAMKGIYDYDLINKIFDPNFLDTNYEETTYPRITREPYYLNSVVRLYCPDYNGNRLDEKMHFKLAKIYTDKCRVPGMKMTQSEHLFCNILKTVESLVGNESCCFAGNVIPHYSKPDIVFGWDFESDKAIPLPASFYEEPVGVLRAAPDNTSKNIVYYTIIVCSPNAYITDNSTKQEKRELTGTSLIKVEHLKKIGYQVILIPYFEWDMLEEKTKIDYLKNKMSQR